METVYQGSYGPVGTNRRGEVRVSSFQEVINMQLIIKTSIITDLDEGDQRL